MVCTTCQQMVTYASIALFLGVGILAAVVIIYLTQAIHEHGLEGLPARPKQVAVGFAGALLAFAVVPTVLGWHPIWDRLAVKLLGSVVMEVPLVGTVAWVTLSRQEADT